VLPVAGLVASDEENRLSGGIEGKEHPHLAGAGRGRSEFLSQRSVNPGHDATWVSSSASSSYRTVLICSAQSLFGMPQQLVHIRRVDLLNSTKLSVSRIAKTWDDESDII
jgi:hypothetical protein